MAWTEINFETTEEHEKLLDMMHPWFHENEKPRNATAKWRPHLSLAYDNPEGSPLNAHAALQTVQEFPTLLSHEDRKVTHIILWSTNGRMDEWYEVDRIAL